MNEKFHSIPFHMVYWLCSLNLMNNDKWFIVCLCHIQCVPHFCSKWSLQTEICYTIICGISLCCIKCVCVCVFFFCFARLNYDESNAIYDCWVSLYFCHVYPSKHRFFMRSALTFSLFHFFFFFNTVLNAYTMFMIFFSFLHFFIIYFSSFSGVENI